MPKVQQSPVSVTTRSAIVVAGMHRSGTSAMARVLGLAGASLPERLIQPGDDNPMGFWEPEEVVALNDEILRTLGSTWNDVFGFRVAGLAGSQKEAFVARARAVLALNFAGEGPVVMKDPRVSLLAAVWHEALVAEGFRPVFVIMVRHPLEVARSIAARDGSPLQASTLAWLSHVIASERDTRDLPRIFVRYTDLLEDWRLTLERIDRHLGLNLGRDTDAGPQIDAYLTRTERHHEAGDSNEVVEVDLWPGIGEAWRWLAEAAGPDGPGSVFPAGIEEDLMTLHSRIGPVLDLHRRDAERHQVELQRALGDNQTQLLRRAAQAAEYQSAQLRLESDLAAAREEVTGLQDRIEVGTAAHAEVVRALDESRERLDEAMHQLAIATATLEAQQDQLTESKRQHRDAEDRACAATVRAEQAAERADQAEASVQSLLTRLETMRHSPSWTLTRPLRVVRKRLSALSGNR